jgi:hypothetical protein
MICQKGLFFKMEAECFLLTHMTVHISGVHCGFSINAHRMH